MNSARFNYIKMFFEINWVRTVYFNFRMLPFKQAVFLPITLTRRIRFDSLVGKIEIKGPLKFALIKFRYFNDDFMSKKSSYSFIKIRGNVIFKGKADFGFGVTLNVAKGGTVIFHEGALIGAKVKIMCENYISLGKSVRLNFESQVFDTNFHYLYDHHKNSYTKRTGSIEIGHENWIGNRTTIMKGTKTPNKTIVGSNSLLNKDYSKTIGETSLIGGSPAKFIRDGLSRLFDYSKEFELNEEFGIKL